MNGEMVAQFRQQDVDSLIANLSSRYNIGFVQEPLRNYNSVSYVGSLFSMSGKRFTVKILQSLKGNSLKLYDSSRRLVSTKCTSQAYPTLCEMDTVYSMLDRKFNE